MPTRRGWRVGAAGIGLVVAGRVLGLVSLYVIGVTAVLLAAGAVAWVRLHRPDLHASRRVRPAPVPPGRRDGGTVPPGRRDGGGVPPGRRDGGGVPPGRRDGAGVHAGDTIEVEVVVTNRAARPSPLLVANDPCRTGGVADGSVSGGSVSGGSVSGGSVSGGSDGPASFVLPPLRPRQHSTVSYQLAARRRGILALGPLEMELQDPFGLAARRMTSGPATRVWVLPRIEPIVAPAGGGEDGVQGTCRQRWAARQRGGDFYALRPYALGDDLRRVHWPSTARSDELMVRQDEEPCQGRTCVLVDLRRSRHNPESLELVVSAAASVVDAAGRQASSLRLVTSEGADSGYARGLIHLDRLLQELAGVAAGPAATLGPAIRRLEPEAGRPSLVLVSTPALTGAEQAGMAALGRWYPLVILVLVEAGGAEAPGTGRGPLAGPPPGRGASLHTVRVGPGRPLALAWAEALGSGSWGRYAQGRA